MKERGGQDGGEDAAEGRRGEQNERGVKAQGSGVNAIKTNGNFIFYATHQTSTDFSRSRLPPIPPKQSVPDLRTISRG